jgi:hypothetical protein
VSTEAPEKARESGRGLDYPRHRAALRRLGLAVFAADGRRLSLRKVTAPDVEAILTIPAKRAIKPVYIRKLLAMIERGSDGEAN